jgi:hypothetical protein
MIEHPAHSLTFGDLTWVEGGANPPDSSGVVYRVRAQDATFGTAVPVTVALLWLGRAGGPVSYDSTPNREPVFRITVEADDSDLLARGEMALQLQCEQPTTLSWTPPDGAGETSVFDVVWSHLEPVFERDGLTGVGMEETVVRSRTYLVHMQALPHARNADLVVTPAQGTATETVIDSGSSTTGWSVVGGGWPVTVVSGAVVVTFTEPVSSILLRRTGTVSLTGASYIAVTWKTTDPVVSGIRLHVAAVVGGGYVSETSRSDAGSGWTTSFFLVPAGVTSTSALTVAAIQEAITSGSYTLSVDKVSTWTALPYIGTTRQKAMSLVPGGSVRTHGSIQVAHASSSLGKTIVYTCPSGTGYLPPLRRWRTSGNTVTADASLLSGSREPIGAGSTVFRIPVSALPKGRVELWAWMRVTTGTLTRAPAYAIRSVINGVTLASSGGNFAAVFTTLNVWQLFCLGAFTTPPIGMGPAGLVQIDLNENSGQVELDEAYLFATDQGSLTVVDCGTGTPSAGGPSNRLWIDAPTPDVPMGAIYRGFSADRSDAFHAGSVAYTDTWGTHDFDPRGTSVFVATANALDAATSLEHYRRYNTFVTREG